MSGEIRHPYDTAYPIAREVYDALRDTALEGQIAIAGSLRRRASTVGDAEIVLAPTPATYRITEELVKLSHCGKGYDRNGKPRWGLKLRRLEYRGLTVELYLVEAISYGYQLALRTGPAEANTGLMYQLPRTPLRCIDGSVWYAKDWVRQVKGKESIWVSPTRKRVGVPYEADFFDALGLPLTPPHRRGPDLYKGLNVDETALFFESAEEPIIQRGLFD